MAGAMGHCLRHQRALDLQELKRRQSPHGTPKPYVGLEKVHFSLRKSMKVIFLQRNSVADTAVVPVRHCLRTVSSTKGEHEPSCSASDMPSTCGGPVLDLWRPRLAWREAELAHFIAFFVASRRP